MKSVLISIKPKYCELIANGKKTVEVRKTMPKLELPFKCYIYCTKAKDYFSIGGGIYVANDELYRLPTGEIKFGDGFELMGDWRGQYDENNFLNGKVIGEFVCDKIDYWKHNWDKDVMHIGDMSKLSCVPVMDLMEYLDGIYDKKGNDKYLYAWHITDLVIYDEPKELGEFYIECNSRNCEKCEYLDVDRFDDDYITRCEVEDKKPITKPPQSWCYVEELGV